MSYIILYFFNLCAHKAAILLRGLSNFNLIYSYEDMQDRASRAGAPFAYPMKTYNVIKVMLKKLLAIRMVRH